MINTYNFIKLILRTYLTAFSRGICVSYENPLPTGPKIIAANHPNATDGFYLPFIFPEKLHFLIQANLFKVPVFGWLLGWAGQIPVHPDNKKKAFNWACEVLARKQTVVIFPEGRLNPENMALKAYTGAVRMSLLSGAPIVPLGFYVPDRHTLNIHYHSRGVLHQSRWQSGGTCYIRCGALWWPSREIQNHIRHADIYALTSLLMEKIRALASQANLEGRQFALPVIPKSILSRQP